jgi:hypothetical protein
VSVLVLESAMVNIAIDVKMNRTNNQGSDLSKEDCGSYLLFDDKFSISLCLSKLGY